MSVPGFDSRWSDFPDYIIGITREIWEERQIHTLHHYYSDDIIVRSPGSVVVGNQKVIGATMATLAEFPDRVLLGEDVIWCGNEQDGFHSSHRIMSTATHSRDGMYGTANGKQLRYRIIADCVARDNTIYDEWLIRDQGAIVRQLGWQPREFTADLIEREGGFDHCVKPLTPQTDIAGPYQSRGNDHEAGQRYADILQRIMNAEMSAIPADYDRACQLELPGGVSAHGTDAADSFWMGLRASFPSASFSVQHVIGRDDANMSPRAAVRWVLHGKHEGWGSFGTPTGADVYILGISHAEFGPWGLRREYVLLDETAVWKQILMHLGITKKHMNRQNSLLGALVADAAAMGLHWMYDVDQMAALAEVGDVLFRQPDAAVFADRKAYFAHAGRHAGELSHYGESVRLLAELVANGEYSTQAHRDAFMASFGPCGSFSGYADRPTKALILKMLGQPDTLADPTGIDDDQLPTLCVIPAMYANGSSRQQVGDAAAVISTHDDAVSAIDVVWSCLDALLEGKSLPEALVHSAQQANSELSTLLDEALNNNSYAPYDMAARFGQACHIKQGLPLSWHLLQHAESFESLARENVLCGGDSCGRSMIIGSIGGVAFGVEDAIRRRMKVILPG